MWSTLDHIERLYREFHEREIHLYRDIQLDNDRQHVEQRELNLYLIIEIKHGLRVGEFDGQYYVPKRQNTNLNQLIELIFLSRTHLPFNALNALDDQSVFNVLSTN